MLKPQFSPLPTAPQLSLGARLTSAERRGAWHDLGRVAAGLGLAASYGLALGVRGGGAGLLQHALGTAFGLVAVAVLAVPSLFLLLALIDAPVSPSALLAASARAVARTGLVLAGLAPSAALLAVTIESTNAVGLVASAGLALGGGIGLAGFAASARELLRGVPLGLRRKCYLLVCAFSLFAIAVADRVWHALPLLEVAR